MEEKKLTYDEIVKALECCLRNEMENTCAFCLGCPASDWVCEDNLECHASMMKNAIDLIHRLQEHNGNEVRMRCDMQRKFDDLQNLCIEQKAEIERLKEMCSKSSYKDSWKNKFFKAQAEIERLTEENKELEKTVNDMSWIIKIHKYCVGANHCQNRSDGEFELQKQVDELKEERQTLVTKYNQTDEAVDYWCEKCKQAVKDTAKDIFDYAKDFFEWDEEGFVSSLKYALKKRYGVEVE